MNLKISLKSILRLSIAGVIIALHWITFFAAIDVSNISITLTMFSTGAFFASLIEPVIYRRRIIWYEIIFGVIVVIGVVTITQSEMKYIDGIVLGVLSAFLSSLFSVLNGSFLKQHSAPVISFYEFVGGILFMSVFLAYMTEGFSRDFFYISYSDMGYLLILASICTAYAFIASVHIMKVLSPYTVVLTYNLEPVYGILVALLLFPEKENMSPSFYYGASVIIGVVLLNGILKNNRILKRKNS